MPNKDQKHEDNVPGRFFVDKGCTVCTELPTQTFGTLVY